MLATSTEIGAITDDAVLNSESDGFPVLYIGRGSYSGQIDFVTSHSFSSEETSHLVYIGRYSAIGDNIHVFCDVNHDYHSVYMGIIPELADLSDNATPRERAGQVVKRMRNKGMVIIGNDVWIGNDVSLISDVTIGNGAVIGAGSVIAKDVPPYTIWCGNPARCIGNRFSPDIASSLQKISWWNYDKEHLKEIAADMKGEVEDFVAKFEPVAHDCSKKDPVFFPSNGKPTIVSFLDTDSCFPTYGDILDQFIQKFTDQSANLLICYCNTKESDMATMSALSGLFEKLSGRVNVFPLEVSYNDEEALISHSDYLVLGRDVRNIQRISYAFKYGVKLVSGVNDPIFRSIP